MFIEVFGLSVSLRARIEGYLTFPENRRSYILVFWVALFYTTLLVTSNHWSNSNLLQLTHHVVLNLTATLWSCLKHVIIQIVAVIIYADLETKLGDKLFILEGKRFRI